MTHSRKRILVLFRSSTGLGQIPMTLSHCLTRSAYLSTVPSGKWCCVAVRGGLFSLYAAGQLSRLQSVAMGVGIGGDDKEAFAVVRSSDI